MGLAILRQLRVGLSKLNFHIFRHDFSDTIDPMCPANDGVEDTMPFCQSYEEPRREPLNGFNEFCLLVPSLTSQMNC